VEFFSFCRREGGMAAFCIFISLHQLALLDDIGRQFHLWLSDKKFARKTSKKPLKEKYFRSRALK
jgi:hypothetical protein